MPNGNKANMQITREILAYPIIPPTNATNIEAAHANVAVAGMADSNAGLNRFKDFYQNTIVKWLKDKQVASCHAWIIGEYLVVLCSNDMPPWSYGQAPIPGLEQFLGTPLPIEELHVFNLPPQSPK